MRYQQAKFLTAADDLLSTYGISGDYNPKLWVPKPAIGRIRAQATYVTSVPEALELPDDSSQDNAQQPVEASAPEEDASAELHEVLQAPSLLEAPAPKQKFVADRPVFKWPTGKLPPEHEFTLATPSVQTPTDDQLTPETSESEEEEEPQNIIYEHWVWPTGKLPPGHVIRLPSPPESPSIALSSYASTVEDDVEQEAPEKADETVQEEVVEIKQVPIKKLFGRGIGYKARRGMGSASLKPKWPTGQLPVEGDEWSSVVAEVDSQPDLDIEVPSEAEARRHLFGKGIGFIGCRRAPSPLGLKFPTGQWSPAPPSDRRSSTTSCSSAVEVPLELHEQRARHRRADLQYLMMSEGVL